MPSFVELAPRPARADPYAPSATLFAEAGDSAHILARAWPRPHTGYFALEPARRHLARVVAGWGKIACAVAFAAAVEGWALRRVVTDFYPAAPAGLAEALRKLEGARWKRIAYARLISLLADEAHGAKVLRHAARIDPELLAVLDVLPAPLRRPRLVAAIPNAVAAGLVARGAKRACDLEDVRALARLAERLERARTTPALFRMLIDEIGVDRLAPPPVPGADWLAPLASTARIENAALRFENCLKGRIPLLLLGRAAYYEVIGDEPAIVEIVRDCNGLWVVGEVRGHANAQISDALWTRIRIHLERHGARTAGFRPDALAIALAQAAGW